MVFTLFIRVTSGFDWVPFKIVLHESTHLIIVIQLAHRLKLQLEVLAGTPLVLAKHQVIQTDMQGFSDFYQGFQSRLCGASFVPFNLVDVDSHGISHLLLRQATGFTELVLK
jgi:hypothetical protein